MKNIRILFIVLLVALGLTYEFAKEAVNKSPLGEVMAHRGFDLGISNRFFTEKKNQNHKFRNRKIQWKRASKKVGYNVFEVAKLKAQEEAEIENQNQGNKSQKVSQLDKKKDKKKAKIVKKGKAQAKKEDKKKKKEGEATFTHKTAENTENEGLAENQQPENKDNNGQYSEQEEEVYAPVANNNEESDENEKSTYEYWENRLLKNPTKSVLMELMDYKASKIVSDEVFYSLIKELLLDTRSSAQKIGIMGISANKSMESFVLLSEYILLGSASEFVQSAQRLLGEYRSIGQVRILSQVIVQSKNDFAVIHAAEYLQFLANKYDIEGPDGEPSTPNLTEQQLQASLAEIEKSKKSLLALIPLLEGVAQNYEDTQVVMQIESTVKAIRGIILASQ